jgi:hypothetical protein
MVDEMEAPEAPGETLTEGVETSGLAGILGALALTASPFLLLFGMWWVDRLLR